MYPKIKICGLSRQCEIEAVNLVKPDYIGFVFAESRLKVTAFQAEALRKNLSCDIIPVGIFVNDSVENIASFARCGMIEIIQLHGDETEDYIEKLKSLADKPIIKAVAVNKTGDAQKWEKSCADYLLFDSKGGASGQVFDWELIGEVQRDFILAGGLNIKNIDAAIQKTKPFAVDTSSGVETNGFKDEDKISKFIRRIRCEN